MSKWTAAGGNHRPAGNGCGPKVGWKSTKVRGQSTMNEKRKTKEEGPSAQQSETATRPKAVTHCKKDCGKTIPLVLAETTGLSACVTGEGRRAYDWKSTFSTVSR